MSTYRLLVYLVSDEIKTISDDSIITEEHISFLLLKYRAFLIYLKYKDIKKEVPESAYQSICLDLETVDALDGSPCTGGQYLRSTEKIPTLLGVGNSQVYPHDDYYQGVLTYVSRERMRYVGHNKYLRNIIYCSLSPNGHLYLKSENPLFLYLLKINFSAVFEDPEEAAKLTCGEDTTEEICDPLDKDFPIEESMIPMLIEGVVKELLGAAYRPEDDQNNAQDDLANLAYYISKNAKTPLQKLIDA